MLASAARLRYGSGVAHAHHWGAIVQVPFTPLPLSPTPAPLDPPTSMDFYHYFLPCTIGFEGHFGALASTGSPADGCAAAYASRSLIPTTISIVQ